jgi:ABC-type spermidine/putrescine transport systems, ATPase components
MAGLNVENLSVVYGRGHRQFIAVNNVSFSISSGEVMGLLGPSGCGKSTLLRAIAGVELPLDGTISWDGEDLSAVPTHKRGFGLMFQDGQLFSHRNVAGNISYGLRGTVYGQTKKSRAKRVDKMLDLVGLPGFQTRAVTSLSGGQSQRVALARALAPDPRVLLLDEPLSALDRGLRVQLTHELHGVLRRAGTTAIYVTHDPSEADAIADNISVMIEGQIVETGTLDSLSKSPKTTATRQFLQ